jgi:ketosteroid isomerase-like protein
MAAVAAFSAALAILVLRDGGASPAPGGSLSSGEVERLARSFARAYETEDSARLAKLLTSDVQRVTPTDRQSGRPAVLAAYKSQFAQNETTRFDLADLESDGGPAARATAHYRVTYRGAADTTGTITFDAIRERGKPKIVMVLARPD